MTDTDTNTEEQEVLPSTVFYFTCSCKRNLSIRLKPGWVSKSKPCHVCGALLVVTREPFVHVRVNSERVFFEVTEEYD